MAPSRAPAVKRPPEPAAETSPGPAPASVGPASPAAPSATAGASPPRSAAAPPGRALRNLGRHTLVYGAGVVASKLASFIMLPIYTRFLTPADYGVLELLSMTVDVVGTLMGLGLAAGVFKFYTDLKEVGEEGEVVSTAAIASIAIALVTATLGILASPLLTHLVFNRGVGDNPLYFRLFFLIYLVQTVEAVPLLLIRARHESVLFVSVNLAKLVGMLTLNIVFVVALRVGVKGVLLSNLIVTSTSALLLGSYMVWRTGARFSREKFTALARFGYPMVFWLLGNFILVFSDRYFLNHYAGPAVVGVYSLAYNFAFVLTTFAFTPFQMVWDPQRYAVARGEHAQEIYSRVFTYLNLALGGVALVMSLYVFDVLRVMATHAFLGAAGLVPVILAAQVVYHWTSFSNVGLFLRERTGVLGRLSLLSVGATLALNFLLIPRFGAWGAAAATFLAYTIRFGAVFLFSQRAFRLHYDWRALARLYGILAAALTARHALGVLPIVPSMAYSTALLLAAAACVWGAVLKPDERQAVRGLLLRGRALLASAAAGGR